MGHDTASAFCYPNPVFIVTLWGLHSTIDASGSILTSAFIRPHLSFGFCICPDLRIRYHSLHSITQSPYFCVSTDLHTCFSLTTVRIRHRSLHLLIHSLHFCIPILSIYIYTSAKSMITDTHLVQGSLAIPLCILWLHVDIHLVRSRLHWT